MNVFNDIIKRTQFYKEIVRLVDGGFLPFDLTGVSGVHKAHIISALSEKKRVLALFPDEAAAVKAAQDISTFADAPIAQVFPEKEYVFAAMEGVSHEFEQRRLQALSLFLSGECRVICASCTAAAQATIPPDVLKERAFSITADSQIELDDLIQRLLSCGYSRCDMVEGKAQFSVRGSIVDIFPVASSEPIRLELWGDEIDSLSEFDIESQRRTDSIEKTDIFPSLEVTFGSDGQLCERLRRLAGSLDGKDQERIKKFIMRDLEYAESGISLSNLDKYYNLAYEKPAFLFDYLDGGLCAVCEYTAIKDSLKSFISQLSEDLKLLYESGVMFKKLDGFYLASDKFTEKAVKCGGVFLDSFMRQNDGVRFKRVLSCDCRQTSGWGGSMTALEEQLRDYTEDGYTVILLAGSEKTLPIIISDLRSDGFDAQANDGRCDLLPGKVYVSAGSLSGGFDYPESRCALITQMRSVSSGRKKKRYKVGEEIRTLSDLSSGDLIVHSIYGIGKFSGIRSLTSGGVKKDYITIKYAGSDVLYVPVTQLDLVSRYISGADEDTVKLNKLGTAEWQKTRARASKAVKDMAEQLTKLYAERQREKGFAFSDDDDWQRDFEERFDYRETDDQLRCTEEIKADMISPTPMDRLLCGDVGFGKTEVAFRAVFKCVNDSKQAAILVPTTVLAWQHYQSAVKRFERFPFKVDMLSRFRTPAQQQATIRELKRGTVDIVIGTHRLIQKDVGFKDLGLVIVDEEQRFGVAAKEKLKEQFKGVDVLTLSATPIPRTLNMALSGIRDMSVIEEAPQDRRPVQTYVTEYDPGVVAQAIQKELRRGGQVYYLYNRIDTIYNAADRISKLLPDARIAVAHGRLGENEMSEIWRQLIEGEIDILVCTTIIETGVDVPNVNTLIIEDADCFGLSQLYQLRGRVGRSSRRAYAYFTFRRGKVLTETAAKRLETIKEFTKFGSGFHIAVRDLEIRGAGSVLSGNQHGHMEAVGYDMYIKLLNEAIAEQKGEAGSEKAEDCLIDINVDAYIPESYIGSSSMRIDAYRKIASIASEEDSQDVTDEFIDRYGEPPVPVMGLIEIALLRSGAAAAGIKEISQKGGRAYFHMSDITPDNARSLMSHYGSRLKFIQGKIPGFSVEVGQGQTIRKLIGEAVSILKTGSLSE